MELRHLRCFGAVAEELHFARAAEKLHIEQSPLSRAIKELEEDLGVRLFHRTTRSTRLTHAGRIFKEHVPRVLTAITQARDAVRAVADGYHGQLRIALSDGLSPSRMTKLLALCREQDPHVGIRLFEVPFGVQVKGLGCDLYDAGFAQCDEVGSGLLAVPAWSEQILIVVSARHPLLAYQRIPVEEVLRYPLILCHPESCEGRSRQLLNVLRSAQHRPTVAEHVESHDLMITLVAAGFGVGFSTAERMSACSRPDVIVRQFAGRSPVLTTYLLRREASPPEELRRFVDRINCAEPDNEALAS